MALLVLLALLVPAAASMLDVVEYQDGGSPSPESAPATAIEPPAQRIDPPSARQPTPLQHRALVIGIDGLRPDALVRAHTPNLDRLVEEGASSFDARSARLTLSGPGWAALLTGVEHPKHGVRGNRFKRHDLGRWPSMFERLRGHEPDARAMAFVAWEPITTKIIDEPETERMFSKDDQVVVDAAAHALAADDATLTFVHLDAVDRAGHRHGYSRYPGHYRRAVEASDQRVGTLMAAIAERARRDAESWLVLVTTDHGGTGHSHNKNRERDREIFFIVHGDAVAPGHLYPPPTLVDVTPTVLSHLGVEVQPDWGLDGRVVATDPHPRTALR